MIRTWVWPSFEMLKHRVLYRLANKGALVVRPCSSKCVVKNEISGSVSVSERPTPIPPISEQRLLRAAVVGTPNAGKSTLINNLIGQKVFAVSPKVHTTQRRALGVFTEGNSQVVVLDTPGVIPYRYGRKLKMEKPLLTDAYRSALDAQIIVVIVDASNKWTRMKLDLGVIRILETNPSVPSILVLNKVDLLRHKQVLLSVTNSLLTHQSKQNCVGKAPSTYMESLHDGGGGGEGEGGGGGGRGGGGWSQFSEVFMVSALTGDGMGSLRNHLLSCAKSALWEYDISYITDQSLPTTAEDVIREKLFIHMDKEIPYIIKQETVAWEEKEDGSLEIVKDLTCKKMSQASILIGPTGRTIQTITCEAKQELERMWERPVQLTLNVRSQKR